MNDQKRIAGTLITFGSPRLIRQSRSEQIFGKIDLALCHCCFGIGARSKCRRQEIAGESNQEKCRNLMASESERTIDRERFPTSGFWSFEGFANARRLQREREEGLYVLESGEKECDFWGERRKACKSFKYI